MKSLLAHPRLYAMWQAPFVRQKLGPVLAHNDLRRIDSVLDIGCGPGTNAALFATKAYRGIDIDAGYVAEARARHGERFVVGDASDLRVNEIEPADCVFVNSLTHHLTDEALRRLLERVDLAAPGGRLHVIDLHLPRRGIGHWLARLDRGEHPRSLARLRELIEECWCVEVAEPFSLTLGPIPLWAMVYFRARPRDASCD